ncbi:ACSF2.2 family protein [Megaselia abdita]
MLRSAKNSIIIGSLLRRFSSIPRQPSYYHKTGKDPLVYRTIGQQLDLSSERYPNDEAVVFCEENKRLNFSDLKSQVDRLAAGFIRLGLEPGDCLAIWAPNYLFWYLSMLATTKAGLISVGLNPAFQGPEIKYALNKVNVKAIVMPESFKSQHYYEILKTIIPDLDNFEPGNINCSSIPSLKTIIVDSKDSYKSAFKFNDVCDIATAENTQKLKKIESNIDPDSPANIQFTSGTTGLPKATLLSHYSMINNGIHMASRFHLYGGERLCGLLPLFHVFGLIVSKLSALSAGATLIVPSPGFDAESTLKAINNEKCTTIHGAPTMYIGLVEAQKKLNLPINTLKNAVTGGAACSPQFIEDIEQILNTPKVLNGFGISELSGATFFQDLDGSREDMLETVGHLNDHLEAKVVNRDGKVVPFGTPGELLVRGYSTMMGYFGDKEKTDEVMGTNGWYRTGDQFILREDGYGIVVGRLKEMIIRGGENIFPKEIEDLLNTHPDIIECYVVGVPDKRMGEEACVFLRIAEGKEMDIEKIQEFCKGKIAHFKIPKYCRVVSDFPKTLSGKIQKFKLTEMFEKGL